MCGNSDLSNSRKDVVLYWISALVSNPSDGLISLIYNCKFLFMVQHETVLNIQKAAFYFVHLLCYLETQSKSYQKLSITLVCILFC